MDLEGGKNAPMEGLLLGIPDYHKKKNSTTAMWKSEGVQEKRKFPGGEEGGE